MSKFRAQCTRVQRQLHQRSRWEEPRAPRLRAALQFLDEVDLGIFRERGSVMKSVPLFLKGLFRNALKFALEEASAQEDVRQVRGWKLLVLLPRMLTGTFCRPVPNATNKQQSQDAGAEGAFGMMVNAGLPGQKCCVTGRTLFSTPGVGRCPIGSR